MEQKTKQTFDTTELDKKDWEQVSRSLGDAAIALNSITQRRLDEDRVALNKIRGSEVENAANIIAKCPTKIRKDMKRYFDGCSGGVDSQIQILQYMINTMRGIANN